MMPTNDTTANTLSRKNWILVLRRSVVASVLAAGCTADNSSMDALPPDAPLAQLEAALADTQASMGSKQGKYAAHYLLAGEYLRARAAQLTASGQDDAARQALLEAGEWFDNARLTSANIAGDRVLKFPEDRSLGTVLVRDWNFDAQFRLVGDARGSIRIDKGNMVQFQASRDFGDADLEQLIAMNVPGAIQYLSLADSKVTSAGVSRLPDLKGLIDLSLHGIKPDASGWQAIASMKGLRHLNLGTTNATTEIIQSMGSFPALEDLALEMSEGIDEEAILTIRGYPRLKTLIMRGIEMSDVSLDYLRQAKELERLWIGGQGITRYGLELLRDLPHLRELIIPRGSITDEEVELLAASLPKCKIDSLDG